MLFGYSNQIMGTYVKFKKLKFMFINEDLIKLYVYIFTPNNRFAT